MTVKIQSHFLIYLICFSATSLTFSQPTLLKDIKEGPLSSMEQVLFFKIGDKLLFGANDGINGSENWLTDGTTTGTVRLVENTTILVDTIFSINNNSLSKTQGTQIVSALPIGIFASYSRFTKVNDGWFFVANIDNANMGELWKTDGTEAGTLLVKKLNPNSYTSPNTTNLIASPDGTKIYFTTGTNSSSKLWKSDGTTEGTEILKNFNTTSQNLIGAFVNLNNETFFRAKSSSGFSSIWKTDGTATGTVLFYEKLAIGLTSQEYIVYQNKIYFSGQRQDSNDNQEELYVSDGTILGTSLFYDINPGIVNSSYPNSLIIVNDLLVFTAETSQSGRELWVTNGTADGTYILNDIFPGNGSGFSNGVFVKELDKFLFTGVNGVERTLWETDGTVAGTLPLYDVSESNVLINSNAGFINNTLIFLKESVANGKELWRVNDNLSQNEVENKKGIKIYPNPTTNILNINNFYAVPVEFRVINQLGQVVITFQEESLKSLDVSNLSDGIYFLNFYFADGNSETLKFIKN